MCKEINLDVLSLDELVRLRKEYKKKMFKYPSGTKEYNIMCSKVNVLKRVINERAGLFKKEETREKIDEFREEMEQMKDKHQRMIEFEESALKDMKIDSVEIDNIIANATIGPVEKYLNVDKITSLEDVKRVLKFLKIKAVDDGIVQSHGFEEVRDLFE